MLGAIGGPVKTNPFGRWQSLVHRFVERHMATTPEHKFALQAHERTNQFVVPGLRAILLRMKKHKHPIPLPIIAAGINK